MSEIQMNETEENAYLAVSEGMPIKNLERSNREWVSEIFHLKECNKKILTPRQEIDNIKKFIESKKNSISSNLKNKVQQLINNDEQETQIAKYDKNQLIDIDSCNEEIDSYLIFFRLIYKIFDIETCNQFFDHYKEMSSSIRTNLHKISEIFHVENKINDVKYYVNCITESFNKFKLSVYEIDNIKEKIKSSNAFRYIIVSLILMSWSELDFETSDEEKKMIISKYHNVKKYHAYYIYKEYLLKREHDQVYSYCEKIWEIRDSRIDKYKEVAVLLNSYQLVGPEKDYYINDLYKKNPQAFIKLTGSDNTNKLEDSQSLLSIMYNDIKSERKKEPVSKKQDDNFDISTWIGMSMGTVGAFYLANKKTIDDAIADTACTACKAFAFTAICKDNKDSYK